jgi:hypothetical protein
MGPYAVIAGSRSNSCSCLSRVLWTLILHDTYLADSVSLTVCIFMFVARTVRIHLRGLCSTLISELHDGHCAVIFVLAVSLTIFSTLILCAMVINLLYGPRSPCACDVCVTNGAPVVTLMSLMLPLVIYPLSGVQLTCVSVVCLTTPSYPLISIGVRHSRRSTLRYYRQDEVGNPWQRDAAEHNHTAGWQLHHVAIGR